MAPRRWDANAWSGPSLCSCSVLFFIAFVPLCQTVGEVHIVKGANVKKQDGSASARALSPRIPELADENMLTRLQLRERLFKSLYLTDEARALMAGLEQVASPHLSVQPD